MAAITPTEYDSSDSDDDNDDRSNNGNDRQVESGLRKSNRSSIGKID